MQGGGKKKQYTPKPKAWKEERSPPKSKASAPFKQNNSTESGRRGVREETHKHKPQCPAGTASSNHLSRQHPCPTPQHQPPVHCPSEDQVLGPDLETHDSDLAEADNKTQEKNETPAIPAHPHGTQPSAGRILVPHSQPLGLPGNQTPHHTSTLPCWHKLKESRAAVGK